MFRNAGIGGFHFSNGVADRFFDNVSMRSHLTCQPRIPHAFGYNSKLAQQLYCQSDQRVGSTETIPRGSTRLCG